MKRFHSILVVLGIAILCTAATPPDRLPSLGQGGTTEIDAILQKAVQQGAFPGVVAIVANKDQILYDSSFGLMDVGKQKPMPKDAIFRIASMTKPVTSVAVMMLV